MSSNRPEKIADLLKKEVSLILSYEVKDPRLQNMNITAVKVTDDKPFSLFTSKKPFILFDIF
jgi:ribosome-binding factor A